MSVMRIQVLWIARESHHLQIDQADDDLCRRHPRAEDLGPTRGYALEDGARRAVDAASVSDHRARPVKEVLGVHRQPPAPGALIKRSDGEADGRLGGSGSIGTAAILSVIEAVSPVSPVAPG